MSDSSNASESFGNTGLVELTGKVAMVAIICFFCVAIFVFSLHIYSKWFLDNDTITTTTRRRRRRRLDFAAGHHQEIVTALYPGLDPLLLNKLPVITYDPKKSEEELECAVCLCEVFEGEKARLLPKCNHGFHVDCIDMWFQSHSTCPLCRNPIVDQNQANPAAESTFESNSREEANIPPNVLFWGNENNVSNNDEGHQDCVSEEPSPSMSNQPQGTLVIDIPRQTDKEDEQKSPVPSRFRALRRLLSGGTRNSNPSTPRNLDVEHGEVVQ